MLPLVTEFSLSLPEFSFSLPEFSLSLPEFFRFLKMLGCVTPPPTPPSSDAPDPPYNHIKRLYFIFRNKLVIRETFFVHNSETF